MTIVFITAGLITALTLLVLYRNLPNKKIFYAFCGTLLLAIGFVSHSVLTMQTEETTDEATIRHITAQQQIFAGWYADYQKQLDTINYNWNQCQGIVNDYAMDNISIRTAYTRLNILEHQAQNLSNDLQKFTPPISLDDGNYELSLSLLSKTQAYADAQLQTIQALRQVTDPATLHTDDHEIMSRLVQETLLRHRPAALFTAAETTALRTRLTLPENQ